MASRSFTLHNSMRSFLALILVTLITAASSVPTIPTEHRLAVRQSCPNAQVYFARGTAETGTIGNVVGPPFSSALTKAFVGTGNTVAFTGIIYPANVVGYLSGGSLEGAQTMADSVTSIANNCPQTKIVISGYGSELL